MRYLKSPTFVVGALLTVSAIVWMLPSVQADLSSFPDQSWDVAVPGRFSLASVSALLVGVVLVAKSVFRLPSRKKRD
jgi:hypothetical protein